MIDVTASGGSSRYSASFSGTLDLFVQLADLLDDHSTDPNMNLLADVYATLVDYRDGKDGAFEKAQEALVVYLVAEAGKQYQPARTWKALKPLLGYLPPQNREVETLRRLVSDFLTLGNLEGKNFLEEIDAMKPYAVAVINAFLAVPIIQDKLAHSLCNQVANDGAAMNLGYQWDLASMATALQSSLDATDEEQRASCLHDAREWFFVYLVDFVREEYRPAVQFVSLQPFEDFPTASRQHRDALMEGIEAMLQKPEFPYLNLHEETEALKPLVRLLIDALLREAQVTAPLKLTRQVAGQFLPPPAPIVTHRKKPPETSCCIIV